MSDDPSSTFFVPRSIQTIGQRCLSAYLSSNRRLWNRLPASLRQMSGRYYGGHLNALVRLQAYRQQYFATFFLRNRPELELMRRIVDRQPSGSAVHLTVLACSKGAEVYSIAWTLRRARPDLEFHIRAIDISQEILDFAEQGVYSLTGHGASSAPGASHAAGDEDLQRKTQLDQNAWIFERLTEGEMEALFEMEGDHATIRPWLKQGITWSRGDAGDPALIGILGPQDIVVAKNFLCHMKPKAAERCLRNIGHMVRPGGFLLVSGIDLNVRSKVARDQGWNPVQELLREVHEGDVSLRRGWPLEYWGLEPFCDARSDWRVRYASAFQIGETR